MTAALVACNNDSSNNQENTETTMADTTEKIQETETETSEGTTEEQSQTTEAVSTKVIEGLDISEDSLSDVMKNMFSDGKYMKNETLFFIDKGDTKRLIYPATKIVSVTSYDGSVTYQEGVDYILTEDGKLQVTENSSIPCITSEVYYNHSQQTISINHNGETKWIYWGEGDLSFVLPNHYTPDFYTFEPIDITFQDLYLRLMQHLIEKSQR